MHKVIADGNDSVEMVNKYPSLRENYKIITFFYYLFSIVDTHLIIFSRCHIFQFKDHHSLLRLDGVQLGIP